MPHDVPRMRLKLIWVGREGMARALSHADDPDDILQDIPQEPEPAEPEAATVLYEPEPAEPEAATVLDWPVPEEPEALIPEEAEPQQPDVGALPFAFNLSDGQMFDIMNDYSPSSTPHAWRPSSTVGPSSDSSLSPDTRAFVYRNDPTILEAFFSNGTSEATSVEAFGHRQSYEPSQGEG